MIEMEEAKRKKIKLGKISYKVPKLKYFKIQSRLKRNDSGSSESESVKPAANFSVQFPRSTPEPVLKAKFNRYRRDRT